jgi:acyl-CoA hydrolase
MSEILSPTATPAAAVLPSMTTVDMVWPDQANHHGTLFGGAALSILDRMAFIGASKALRGAVVTASVGKLNFLAPAPAGHLVECHIAVTRRGNRSATLEATLLAEDLLSGARTDCLSGEFIMVRRADDPAHAAAARPQAMAVEAIEPDTGMASAMVAEIVFPGHANHRHMLHGGPAMEWMAKAGFVAATRQVRLPLVMASSEKLDFRAPAFVGDVVEVTARVTHVGRRSVQVQMDMWSESPTTGERRHCTSGQFVYVTV